MKTLLKILTLGLIYLICQPIFAQKNAQLKLDFEKIILSKHSFPFNGVVIVSKNGKTIYEKVHGFKNFEEKIALNKTYLPEITQSWADSVTVHQLLNHTHGIQDITKPLLFKPGTDFKYGNYSCVLLGKILTKVTHKTFRELATNLIKEIGLKETFVYSESEKHQLAQAYFYRNDSLIPNYQTLINEENLPADGIISTANDLVKWNNLLHNGKILQLETYQLLITPSTLSQHDVFGKTPQGYAYNIRNVTENNINYIGHTGLGDGFSAINIYFPKSKVSLVVLQNIMPDNSEDYYFYEKQFKNLLLENDLTQ